LEIVMAIVLTVGGWHESFLHFERSAVDTYSPETGDEWEPPFEGWILENGANFAGQHIKAMRLVKSAGTGGFVMRAMLEYKVE
jgi:hypothetical protein